VKAEGVGKKVFVRELSCPELETDVDGYAELSVVSPLLHAVYKLRL